MNQEKSILELLIIVRNYLEGITIIKGNHLYPLGGLCHIIFNLQGNIDKEMPNRNNKYLISDLEHYILHTYIHKHRPKRGMFYDSEYKRTAFFLETRISRTKIKLDRLSHFY